jgi:hypothetical protein
MDIMSKVPKSELPPALKPYSFHGLHFNYSAGKIEVPSDCPFCHREGKFSVNIEKQQWRCVVCDQAGNAATFIKRLWTESLTHTKKYKELAQERKILNPKSLVDWGLAESMITGEWVFPSHNADGALNNLYRYVRDPKTGKKRLLATAEMGHGMYGLELWDAKKPEVYICEGPWDAIVLREVLGSAKLADGKITLTSNEKLSLLAGINVIAVPGSSSFSSSWAKLFAGKKVTILFDSDHPKELEKGRVLEPVGYVGMQKVVQALGHAPEPPESLHYLNWGPNGYDEKLASGFDVRDMLTDKSTGGTALGRLVMLSHLRTKLSPIPQEWLPGRTKEAAKSGGVELELLPCQSWKALQNQCRRALKWTEGLDQALSFMLSVILSTESAGEQLWGKIIAPPSTGKSTLCEAVGAAKKYVYSKDTFTGLLSGYQLDKEGSENMSMVNNIKNKTLVINDGDTLLKSPNREQVLSQLRAFYGRNIRAQYGNKMSKDFEDTSCTILICGTASLRELDASDLGARFLDCVIMKDIDEDLEHEILMRAGNLAAKVINIRAGESSGDAPDKIKMRQLTGGYVKYLRENAMNLLAQIPTPSQDIMERISSYAKFVAYLRARPSKSQDESVERELASRLMSQLVRLAICQAVVLNRKEVDEEVLRRVRQVALDTSHGAVMEILKLMYSAGREGVHTVRLASQAGRKEDDICNWMLFLQRIKIVDHHVPQNNAIKNKNPKWRMTERMLKLWKEVVLADESNDTDEREID